MEDVYLPGDMRPEPTRPKFVPVGIPVDMDRHAGAFRRDWSDLVKKQEVYVPPPPPVILVPMRDAGVMETPVQATELLADALDTEVLRWRVTYAHGGPERLLPQTGVCRACFAVTTINADGSLRSHNYPTPEKCPGVGREVGAYAIVTKHDARGKVKSTEALCLECGQMAAVSRKKGPKVFNKHGVPVRKCESEGAGPGELLPRQTLEPVRSICLRLLWDEHRRAVGCWHDMEFEEAWIFVPWMWLDETTGERVQIGYGPVQVGIKAFTEYVRTAGNGASPKDLQER